MLKLLDYTEEEIETGYPETVITTEDLIEAYGRQGEIRRFCHECVEWKTCKGTKWSTCPHRKYYIKEEVKGKYQPKVSRYKRLTKEQKENIISMYRKGIRACDIARAMGIKSQTIQNVVRQLKDFKYKQNAIDWSKYDSKIIESVNKGGVIRNLIGELGLTQYQVYERVKTLKHKGVIDKNVDGRRR